MVDIGGDDLLELAAALFGLYGAWVGVSRGDTFVIILGLGLALTSLTTLRYRRRWLDSRTSVESAS